MNLIKNKNMKYIFIGIVIILILFLGVVKGKSQEKAIEPITYDFVNDSILDIDQENDPNYYNIREQSEYLGNYEAKYSFENDIIGSVPIDWIDNSGINCKPSIVSDYYGHNKVLEILDDSGQKVNITNEFENIQSTGSISFWWLIPNNIFSDIFCMLGFYNSLGVEVSRLSFSYPTDQIKYYDGSWKLLYDNVENNTWYYIEYDFDCTIDSFNFSVNNQLIETDCNFSFNTNEIAYFEIYTKYLSSSIYIHYFDAFDYSWSNQYFENRNFIPQKENTEYLEVDKYEFDYNYDEFENDFYDWKQFEKNSSSNNVLIHSDNDISNYINIYSYYGSIYNHGFNYTNINSNAMILNISFIMEISSSSGKNTYYNDVLIGTKNWTDTHDYIKFKFSEPTEYFSIWNSETEVYDDIFEYADGTVYSINVYMNFYDGILIYRITSDTYNGVHNFILDNDNDNLYGLNNITVMDTCLELADLSSFQTNYYSIGIYEYGKSFIDFNNEYEFGLMSYQMYYQWNSDCHNILTIDSINDYKLYVNLYSTYFLDGYIIRERNNQTQLEITNLQDKYDNNYPKFIYNCPYLIFQLYGNFTNFYEIEIEGIKLKDNNGLSVYGNYYYNNSNPNNNWFYVIDNKLYYYFNNSENLYTETMRISFNIYDVLLDNESLISYSSYITNNYSGNIYVSSYRNTEIFNISESDLIENTYLNMTDTLHFTLKEILIEIRTNDNSNGLAYGYIQNLNIYPEKPLFPDFEPIEFLDSTFMEKMIETIIPIIFFIIPSFLIKSRFGNKGVIPIWILITFVLLITNFIPFWICFIIFLGIGLMSLNKDEVLE